MRRLDAERGRVMDPVAYLVDDGRNMAAFTNRDSAVEYAVDMQRWNGGVIPRLVPLAKLSAALRRERKLRRAVLAQQHHSFIVLTKRAARMRRILSAADWWRPVPPNIWLGVSVENQAAADERIPQLLATPAAVRWVSVEPMLGPVSFGAMSHALDWIVCGAETGHGARQMDLEWARSVRESCGRVSVPFFFKRDSDGNGTLDGVVHHEWPVAQ